MKGVISGGYYLSVMAPRGRLSNQEFGGKSSQVGISVGVALVWMSMISFVCVNGGIPVSYRGIAPKDLSYYSNAVINCRDGSGTIPVEQVNDNFCDCLDGTDEPGTSACPDGVFFCRNKGHTPKNISSAFVNDGICDCCDGSDEWDGRTTCRNVCKDLGSETRNQLTQEATTQKEGLNLRRKYVDEGQQLIHGWKTELNKLAEEKKTVDRNVSRLRELKEAVEKAENEEKERQEHERKAREEAEKKEVEGQASVEAVAPSSNPSQTCSSSLSGDGCKGNTPEGEDGSASSTSFASDHQDESAGSREGDEQTLALQEGGKEQRTLTEQQPGEEVEGKSLRDATEEEMATLSNEDIGRLIASRWTGEQVTAREKEEKKEQSVPEEKLTPKEEEQAGAGEDKMVRSASHEEDEEVAEQDEDDVAEQDEDDVAEQDEDDVAEQDEDDVAELDEEIAEPEEVDGEHDSGRSAAVEKEEHGDGAAERDGYRLEDHDAIPADANEYGHDDGIEDPYYHGGSDDEESYYKQQEAEKEEETSEAEVNGQEHSADTEDSTEKPKESWWSRVMELPRGLRSKVTRLFKRVEPVPISEAGRIRAEYSKVHSKSNELSRRIGLLDDNLKKDYGPDGAFAVLQGQCFELTEKQYVYKVCPYGTATQNEGHSSTSLGSWGGWKDNYSKMVFENGQQCWNGPQRSLKVTTKCGLTNQLSSVTEPSRCEYLAEFSSPLSCGEGQLKEIEMMLKELSVGDSPMDTHDEF